VTRLMFNASNSVCKYDIVIETLKVMAISESDIPSELILRQVDDVPVVSPEVPTGVEEKFPNFPENC
jgi:hypothetical protein